MLMEPTLHKTTVFTSQFGNVRTIRPSGSCIVVFVSLLNNADNVCALREKRKLTL